MRFRKTVEEKHRFLQRYPPHAVPVSGVLESCNGLFSLYTHHSFRRPQRHSVTGCAEAEQDPGDLSGRNGELLLKQTLTAKIKIEVDPSAMVLLHQTMQTYASACNFVSDYIFHNRDLNRIHLHDALYYRIREQYGLGAQMTESVIKTVIARYKTILENQKEWIRPNFKTPQADLVRGRDYTFCLGRKTVSITTL